MPQAGISSEWLADREDEIAQFIIAREQADGLHHLVELLRQRRLISEAYYQDARDSLDYIIGVLLVGKKNTATLRNHPPA